MGDCEKPELEAFVVDGISPNRKWAVVFEDDGETGYLYLANWLQDKGLDGIVDALWIYNQISPTIQECRDVYVIWNNDSTRAGLIVDNECWGILDLANKRKMNASRKDNSIKSIPKFYWENGLGATDGESLRMTK